MTQETFINAAKKFKTPLYLFDLDELTERVEGIRETFHDAVSLCYAMKANPFLTSEMASLADRIEVCSPGEFSICKLQGIPMQKIIVSGVLKEEKDIRQILIEEKELPLFTAESAVQVTMLRELAEQYQRKIRVLLRLTSGNQFGMDEETLFAMVKKAGNHPYVMVAGLHFYSGTQKRKTDQIRKELELLDEVCIQIRQQCGIQMEQLEYGPGFAVEYFNNAKDEEPDFGALKEVAQCVKTLRFGGKVTFEMGRFFSAMCGYYLTKVREIKENCGIHYCLVDGGLHHLNYDGQVMAMKTPYCRQIPLHENESEEKYQICGALCTVNDILIKQYPLKGIQPGDYLVFERTGAYSMTEGMSLFLSRDLPAAVCYSVREGLTTIRTKTPVYPLNMKDQRHGR